MADMTVERALEIIAQMANEHPFLQDFEKRKRDQALAVLSRVVREALSKGNDDGGTTPPASSTASPAPTASSRTRRPRSASPLSR